LIGTTLVVPTGSLTLSSGSVTLTATATNSDICIGACLNPPVSTPQNNFQIQAGALTATAGSDISVDVAALTLGSFQNNGAHVNLTAGQSGSGNLFINGTLDVTGPPNLGAGSGNGGTVSLTSSSTTHFTIDPSATV